MAYGESKGHVTDNITWPRKVKSWVVTPILLESNIAKTAIEQQSLITISYSLLRGSAVGYLSDSLASC